MMRIVVVVVLALLGACSGAKDNPGQQDKLPGQAASAIPPAAPAPPRAAPASAIAVTSGAEGGDAEAGGAARTMKDENDLLSFEYSYPAAAAAIPALRTRLEADLATAKAKLRKDAVAGQADSRTGNYPYHAHYWSQKWSVVTDLPLWLSLSAQYSNYTGGAHGMYWFGAMLWDKRAGVPRDPLTLFTSKQALSKTIRQPFCAALNKQRAIKRGEPVDPRSTDAFDACIDPVGETVILGSHGRQAFDRIGILVPPYEAGSYAEGSYEVTVPVTAAVLGAVKPQFRGAFSAPK